MKRIALGLIVYAAVATITFGAMNATAQWKCHHQWQTICDERMVRRDIFVELAFAVFPPAWIVALMVTYGYADGISFTAEPHLKSGMAMR